MIRWRSRRQQPPDEGIAATRALVDVEDPDSVNPDVLAKVQRETSGQRSAWNALTHRRVQTEWRGD